MTGFEYLTVLISVVVGLAVTRIMGGVATLVEARTRVRLYWLHIIWVINVLLMDVQIWWGTWSLKDYHWNFRAFILVLFVPGLLYLLSDLLVPNVIEDHNQHMADHYETVRPIFFLLLVIYHLCSVVANHFLFGAPLITAVTLIPASLGLGALVCMLTRNRIVHGSYAIIAFVGLLVFISVDKQILG